MDFQKINSQAVVVERNSQTYPQNYYEVEKEAAGLFLLDTKILTGILRPGASVFDATMGPGRHIVFLAKHGFQMYGNDYNPHMVAKTRQELDGNGLSATLYNQDIRDLSAIPSNSFDYIICMFSGLGVLPGAANRLLAMKEFYRLLKPGGQTILHAHNRLNCFLTAGDFVWAVKTYWPFGRKTEIGDYYYNGSCLGYTFVHLFSPRELKNLIEAAGFEIVRKIYLNKRQVGFLKRPFRKLRSGGFIFVGKK